VVLTYSWGQKGAEDIIKPDCKTTILPWILAGSYSIFFSFPSLHAKHPVLIFTNPI